MDIININMINVLSIWDINMFQAWTSTPIYV